MAGFSRVFTLEVDGQPILAFEAGNTREANHLCKEVWLLDDLALLSSGGAPLWTAQSQLSVRLATAKEVIVFGHMSRAAKPSDDLMLAYLVELDCRE